MYVKLDAIIILLTKYISKMSRTCHFDAAETGYEAFNYPLELLQWSVFSNQLQILFPPRQSPLAAHGVFFNTVCNRPSWQ
jgi:hypothetical protein